MDDQAKPEVTGMHTNQIVDVGGVECRMIGIIFNDALQGYILQPTDEFLTLEQIAEREKAEQPKKPPVKIPVQEG